MSSPVGSKGRPTAKVTVASPIGVPTQVKTTLIAPVRRQGQNPPMPILGGRARDQTGRTDHPLPTAGILAK